MREALREITPWMLSGALLLSSASGWAGPLDELPVGQWYRVPNSLMREVAHDWSPDRAPGNAGGIIKAWGGGAFDVKGERLLVHGGGHGDYGGNEVYALDLQVINDAVGTNPWTKLSSPSPLSALDPQCENEDNLTDDDQRRSQHTYSRLAYVPALNALCDTGGSIGYVYCPALRQLDCFDLTTNQWRLSLAEGKASGTGSVGAVHPVTGQWWLQGGSGSGLLGRLDPETLTWTYGRYDNIPGSSPGNMSAAIDPKRDLLIVTGRQRLWVLPLDQFEEGETELSEWSRESAGGEAVINASAPGLAYDPVGDQVVAWLGGAEVYTLNLDTWQWTSQTLGGDTPGAAASNGTFGRFQYSPKYNVFVVVSSADEDAYVVKLGQTPPQCQPEQTQPCYTGDQGTQQVGVCAAGQQRCEQGRWGACEGEVLPSAERCGDALDNDCDGSADEGCAAQADMGDDMATAPADMATTGSDQGEDLGAKTLRPSQSSEGCGCSSAARPEPPLLTLLGLFLVGGVLRRVRLGSVRGDDDL